MIHIYVVSHKPVDLEALHLDSCYKRIRVGNYEHLARDELCDCEGEDNIAYKNESYCELTGLYWAWKHDKDTEYIGLCHYRRFFTSLNVSNSPKGILTEKEIALKLKKCDIIVPQKTYFWNGVIKTFLDTGYMEDVHLTTEAIRTLFPDYLAVWNREIMEGPSCYLYNMFLMSRRHLQEYCDWLFSILSYVESHHDITNYDKVHKRVYGYLAERLLSVWIAKNNLQVSECRVLNTEEKETVISLIKKTIKQTHASDMIKACYYYARKKFPGASEPFSGTQQH